jgi:multicomponent Na+:H+ antiporter subunit F
MTPLLATWTTTAVTLAMAMMGVAMFLAFFRLVLGPTLPDRVVALDLIGTLSVGFIAAYDIRTNQPILLDAATVVALVAFLATVAFAHYVQRRARHE